MPEHRPDPAPENTGDRTLKTWHGTEGPVPAPDDPAARLAVAAEPQLVAGYEIDSELGRGGMGVVYKARQAGLHRTVALKMIKQVDLASTTDRLRFHREAEALARLEHPNIVRVYEVGEYQGQPFFSMEFVAGGSLDHVLRSHPLPGREAAALVETLARAMQAAHEGGIIHRDLKPANVLLSASDAPQKRSSEEHAAEPSLSGAVPKITDFGLAKTLGEVGQTQSGEVMGTPSYMAPEQAAGRVHLIDARTDVWALGAILYECLTGRPPFRASSVVDTLMQVLNEEPVSVRQLVRVPADLETICHKCLTKEPARRYASAADLAEDLRRFREGESILARRVTPLGRGVRWCRRNPGLAASLAAAVLALVAGSVVSTVFAARAHTSAQLAREKAEEAEANAGRAEKNERSARRLASVATRQRDMTLESFNTLLLAVEQKLRDTPENRRLKDSLLKTAVEGLERLSQASAEEVGADPGLADAHVRLARSFARLGNMRLARREYQAALAVLAEVLRQRPGDPAVRLLRGRASSALVSLLVVLEPAASLRPAVQAVEELEALLRDRPADPAVQEALASACQELGRALRGAGDLPGAGKVFRRSLALAETLAKADPQHAGRQLALSEAQRLLGELHQQAGDRPAAHAAFAEAVAAARAVAEKKPEPSARTTWMAALMALAGQSARKEAADLNRKALGLARGLAEDQPYNMLFKVAEITCCSRLSESNLTAGDRGWAREYAVPALTAARKVHASEPTNAAYRTALREAHELSGRVSEAWGGTLAARNHYRQALSLLPGTAGAGPDEKTSRERLALHRKLGDLGAKLGHRSDARRHYQEALALARRLKDKGAADELTKRAEAVKAPDDRFVSNSIGLDLVLIRPGKFLRGGEQEPKKIAAEFREVTGLWLPEHPRHEAAITRRFYLGAAEVTRGQFRAFVRDTNHVTDAEKDGKGIGDFNPSGGTAGRSMENWRADGDLYLSDDHPVSGVSWNDAVAFCRWLSKKEGKRYRLPTEAEWEYACRAGTTTRYFSGDDPETLVGFANVPDASFREARSQVTYATLKGRDGFAGVAPVGSSAPNPWGLFDMHGNVWEWCLDGWDPKAYEAKVRDDPRAALDRPMHAIRGGCFM